MKAPFLLIAVFSLCAGSLAAQAPGGATSTTAVAAAALAPSGNVTPEAATKLLQADSKITVLDVRTAEEFSAGHIAGATNISSADPQFASKVAALDTSRPLILHCAAGGRSGRVLPIVQKLSFPAIYHLNGGFNAWKAAGQPVTK